MCLKSIPPPDTWTNVYNVLHKSEMLSALFQLPARSFISQLHSRLNRNTSYSGLTTFFVCNCLPFVDLALSGVVTLEMRTNSVPQCFACNRIAATTKHFDLMSFPEQ